MKSDVMDIKKVEILNALETNLGVVTAACKQVKISRETYYKWLREDEEFKGKVKDIENVALDFVESQLFKNIKEGNATAQIFYLKTKGKNRGFVERTEITGADSTPLFAPTINVTVELPNK